MPPGPRETVMLRAGSWTSRTFPLGVNFASLPLAVLIDSTWPEGLLVTSAPLAVIVLVPPPGVRTAVPGFMAALPGLEAAVLVPPV